MLTDASATGPTPAAGLIKETSTAGFRQDVIAESMNQPVLVDFWAPWCGPCKQLTPILEKVVTAAGGKVKLVKLNIDEHPAVWQQIGQQLGLQSIPAVIAIDRGRPVDAFMGAIPESEVKSFVGRLAGPSEVEQVMEEAAAAAAAGDLATASQLYAAVIQEEPENIAALAALAKIQVDAGQLDHAKQVLAMVPAGKENDPLLAGVKAALELAEQAESLGDLSAFQHRIEADPDDHQARFDLALGLNALGKRDEAVDQLVAIARRDRNWNEDAARKQLLQFFEAWGLMDPAAIRGRRQLSTILFS
ncbi:thioredoxin family protein [Methylobacterium organophilum]|uniref:Chaperedoxin n=1 Tax=Methylobacterium organophilum TaxID=410 RepID=A0ABQ4TB73_METOR|nr:co-chaperone YbbN [Methylobacterium organophilum]GJE27744.1 Chaperedoxin [Methylobacterium organophilum]